MCMCIRMHMYTWTSRGVDALLHSTYLFVYKVKVGRMHFSILSTYLSIFVEGGEVWMSFSILRVYVGGRGGVDALLHSIYLCGKPRRCGCTSPFYLLVYVEG